MTYKYVKLWDGRVVNFPPSNQKDAIAYVISTIKEKPIEYAYMLHPKYGLINYGIGSKDSVTLITPTIYLDGDIIDIHNHPDNGIGRDVGFSTGDLVVAISENAKEMAVITFKSIYYIGRPGISWSNSVDEVKNYHANLYKRYFKKNLVFSSDEARCNYEHWASHRLMEQTSKKFGFNYKRVSNDF